MTIAHQMVVSAFTRLFPSLYSEVKKYTIKPASHQAVYTLTDGRKLTFSYTDDAHWTLEATK